MDSRASRAHHADLTSGIGYGYVTTRIGTKQDGDPRDVALRRAVDAVLSG